MATTPVSGVGTGDSLTSSIDEMLLAALDRPDDSQRTGRYIVTYKEGAGAEGLETLRSMGMRTADARDFTDQAVGLQDVGDADALVLPEIGVAIVSGPALAESSLNVQDEIASDSPIDIVEPEYFVFSDVVADDYLRGFRRAVEVIAADLGSGGGGSGPKEFDTDPDIESLGVTWGLAACRVPQSTASGAGIRVAVLDTGMDLGHPDFVGRGFATNTFVGQPVQDLHSHGTHCIGTSCGPFSPPGSTPRYGIAHRASIFVGKVLSNSGSGATGSVLAGMNWAIANRCAVISMSLGSQSPVQAAYTAAGQAALNAGCLIIAAAGNAASNTGSPANSPTIMSVASLDANLAPSSFSNFGKIDISGPGRDVYSSVPRPTRYGVKSGTSMATPHVAGCAALWAQTNAGLRGLALRNRLIATARRLPYPPSRVGAGLVQAPA
ncbi:S8 family serine peptidase [Sphingomonas mollis]|uniref:S8 family serine peptidase n=1 Tax=Sphingomonas mollis TaxID=2795726 RepID=A0ABS0XNM7_9SPHN|nr:S8 family serine peptidase [Sphingomonas sp. BT553]MBJ6121644.1 S8 family serine peptidase [Sphingomonas sp. BT553]